MKETIRNIRALEKQLYAYRYAMTVIDYDSETVAPSGGGSGRAVAAEVLSRASFDLLISPETDALLLAAAEEAEGEQERAEVRELRQQYDEICNIPAEEYAAFSGLVNQSIPAWVEAKRNNNFAAFAPWLEKLIEGRRKQAAYAAPGRDPYEVWLDRYERGLTVAQCDAFFDRLRLVIVPLLADIRQRGTPIRTDFLHQDWPLEGQRKVSALIMKLWGIDPAHCVLGEAEHPFTTNYCREDVRVTTHYFPEDMVSNLYTVAHESGHALYDMGSAPELDYTVLSGGATMGLHESQSRLFENYVARSKPFLRFLFPKLQEIFPGQLENVTAEEFYRAVNRAEPGLIRTEADELTYSLHIMVRYELEKALMRGELSVAELPEAWNRKYQEYLGVTVPSDSCGVLQDIHWAAGDIGYFPSYALGNAYGAQAMKNLREAMDLDAQFQSGNLEPLKAALKDRLWKYGCMKEPAWLVKSLCGGEFDPRCYTDYLQEKYTELYAL